MATGQPQLGGLTGGSPGPQPLCIRVACESPDCGALLEVKQLCDYIKGNEATERGVLTYLGRASANALKALVRRFSAGATQLQNEFSPAWQPASLISMHYVAPHEHLLIRSIHSSIHPPIHRCAGTCARRCARPSTSLVGHSVRQLPQVSSTGVLLSL